MPLLRHLALCLLASVASAAVPLASGDTVLWYGNSLGERLLEQGDCEALVQLAVPGGVSFRSLAWTGDEVGYRLRPEGYVDHLRSLIAAWPAQVVIVAYGMNESHAGGAGLDDFRRQYAACLQELAQRHAQAHIVLLSPFALDDLPAHRTRNQDLAAYSAVIGELAQRHRHTWIDLYTLTSAAYASGGGPFTRQQQPTAAGLALIARLIAEALVGPQVRQVPVERVTEVARAAARKAGCNAALTRPTNGVVYYGARKRTEEYDAEIPRYHRLLAQADEAVRRLAATPTLRFADLPALALPPMSAGLSATGGETSTIPSPVQQQGEFTVAPGYAVGCFASEADFPDLRNPVQMAIDARGRVWVTTMPSFPHTVPGETPDDRILILEDLDRDGRADSCTVFAHGFDALDGIAFHERGVVVSAQPRLLLLQDRDGDDRADVCEELVRGIDVTDSHHGGMVAVDPLGQVLFSDGLFHRSQIETPFGVVRGIDSTTYRLDPASGRVTCEWRSRTPNPWKIAFTRQGDVLQRYGGGQTLDGMRLGWTPLGVFHPYGVGTVLADNKGCAASVVSGGNFPAAFQQGLVSASLLGRHAVSMARLTCDDGPLRADERVDLLSTRNLSFRPVDTTFGLDGALYVADFASVIIGHAQHAMRDPRWDHRHGRIWRVVHTKMPETTSWPDIIGADLPHLLDLLAHPQDQVRDHVRLRLRALGPVAVPALDAWIAGRDRSDAEFPQHALEALRVLHAAGAVRPALLAELLGARDARARVAAVMLMRFQADDLPDLHQLLARAATDPHPRVRMAVLNVVSHLRRDDPHVVHAIAGLSAGGPVEQAMLADLDSGITPTQGRAIPVLAINADATIAVWQRVEAPAHQTSGIHAGRPTTSDITQRTIVESARGCEALLSVRHGRVSISLDGTVVYRSDRAVIASHQVTLALKAGLNAISISYPASDGTLPEVALHDVLGQTLPELLVPLSASELTAMAARWRAQHTPVDDVLRVRAVPGRMQFEPTVLRARVGTPIHIALENHDLMAHNLVLCAPGSGDAIGALADLLATQAEGLAKHFVPDSPHVLAATDLVEPAASATLTLRAPLKAGTYPFLCTFPGHWRIMRGELVVGE